MVVLGGWLLLVHIDQAPSSQWLSPSQMGLYLAGAILAAAFAFNGTGGSAVVTGILNLLPQDRADGPEAGGCEGAGRLIGILERTLMLLLVLYGQWAATVLLVTAKSIARFEEIKKRKFAEYYLVGTLASFLVAAVTALMLTAVVFPALA